MLTALRPAVLLLALAASMPANAALFSLDFAFPYPGLAEVPGSTLLASNEFATADAIIGTPTRLSLYRLRQTNADNLLGGLTPPDVDIDLVLGDNRFDIANQAFDPVGQLLGSFTYVGGLKNSLGVYFFDGADAFIYYADLPFELYAGAGAVYDGIGPYVGTADTVYFTLPGDSGLYRLQAAVPEPASWAMLIAGFGLTGAALRRRRLKAA